MSPRNAHDWSTFLRLAAEAPVVGFAAGWRRDGALGGVAIALEVDRRPPIVWWVPLSDAAADDDGADATLEPDGACWGERRSRRRASAAMRTSRRSWRRAWRCRHPVYDPMHAAALLQPHIDAPPKLSELLTLRSATHAALARCDGGRTAHESGCVHAARSLAACCELLPAVAEQGLTAPLKASLTPLSHALQLLGRGAIGARSAAACAALLPRGASDARARSPPPTPPRTAPRSSASL